MGRPKMDFSKFPKVIKCNNAELAPLITVLERCSARDLPDGEVRYVATSFIFDEDLNPVYRLYKPGKKRTKILAEQHMFILGWVERMRYLRQVQSDFT